LQRGSAPIGTPPRTNSARNIKCYVASPQDPDWVPFHSMNAASPDTVRNFVARLTPDAIRGKSDMSSRLVLGFDREPRLGLRRQLAQPLAPAERAGLAAGRTLIPSCASASSAIRPYATSVATPPASNRTSAVRRASFWLSASPNLVRVSTVKRSPRPPRTSVTVLVLARCPTVET
jgi:hypothetical protein